MNFADIKKFDVANGIGVRVSLFVSGCTHRCKGCFNEEAWAFDYGKEFTEKEEEEILQALAPDYIRGLSLLGGEPFEPVNQRRLVPFLKKVKAQYPQKDIWCYTGFLLDKELLAPSRARCEVTDEMLSLLDILVDGEFIEEKKNLSIRFRGSENQRIIDLRASFALKDIVLWKGLEDESKYKKT